MSVYFIRVTEDAVKIGHAQKPYQRLVNLQAGAIEKLTMISCIDGGREMERELHRRFHAFRIRGEMFRRDGVLRDYIETLPPPPPKPIKSGRPRGIRTLSTEKAQSFGSRGGKAKAEKFKADLNLSLEQMRTIWFEAESNKEAEERTGVSARTLHRWFDKSGRPPGFKSGKND